MIDNFQPFARQVAAGFQAIMREQPNNVFVVDVDGDELYKYYLDSFPPGTNPIFKARTEHDCGCCKHFIRRIGNVVTVTPFGGIITVWDDAAEKGPGHYRVVAQALREKVLNGKIVDLFRVGNSEVSFSNSETRSLDKETNKVHTWNHFFSGEVLKGFRAPLPDQVKGDYRTTVQVFERGLLELGPSAVETVLSLVDANSLYRGTEFRPALTEFQKAQKKYQSLEGKVRQTFVWTNAHGPAARFRNTSIGTLVQDLSEGKDLESAVKAFEAKVAPQNYKRTTALITPGMVKDAMKTIQELDLESALERRFARIEDISVNDVLWVDGVAKKLMKGGIGDVLMQHAVTSTKAEVDETKAEDIDVDTFVKTVLPETSGMELHLKGGHLGNLVSLTAPVHPEPKQLFQWTNDFAWSYVGNVTDSIKERVKKAGGRVEGVVLRISLSWFNYDDLDLHIYEPKGRGVAALGDHIHFRQKQGWTGGFLDVDMNASGGTTREAVENVMWPASRRLTDGAYKVVVNNFAKRETSNPGFVIEVEHNSQLSHYTYNKPVRERYDVHVISLHVESGKVVRVEMGDPAITASNISLEKWGLNTEQWVKVNCVTLSPNFWGENAVGNKHTFFMLDGAKSDEATRGIYNEYLHPRLTKHRKVFEVIGDKTKCDPASAGSQLSGLGFSSTKQDSLIVKVMQGKKQRLYNVRFGA